MSMFYIPCKDEKEARHITNTLFEKKLIACANFYPSTSIYPWKGKMKETTDTILILKTSEEKMDEVEKLVKELHSFELPAIIRIKTEENKEYSDWVNSCVRP